MRVLIIRLWALGDVVVTTPLLSRIRAEWPDAHVTWLTGTSAAPIVSLLPGVDEILTVEDRAILGGNVLKRARTIARVWKEMLSRKFDRVLLYHADARYKVLTLPLRLIGRKIDALDHSPGPRRNPLPGRFRGDEVIRLFDRAFADEVSPSYQLADLSGLFEQKERTSSKPRVAIIAGGARNLLAEDVLRRWPTESYVALAEELLKNGCEVTLLGDAGDRPFADSFRHLPVEDRVGRTTLHELLGALRNSDVVVSHDTGPMHMARLVRTPIVAIFGPTDPGQVVGNGTDVTVLWGGETLACRPCYDGKRYARCSDNICMKSVSVPRVLAAVRGRIGTAVK
jgi:heptosyltransferase II